MKRCQNCAWNNNRGVCAKYDYVPMSLDGKGKIDCVGWEGEEEFVEKQMQIMAEVKDIHPHD